MAAIAVSAYRLSTWILTHIWLSPVSSPQTYIQMPFLSKFFVLSFIHLLIHSFIQSVNQSIDLGSKCATAHRQRPENNLWKSVLCSHSVDSRGWTQTVVLGSKRFYLLSHFDSLEFCFFIKTHFCVIRAKPMGFIFNWSSVRTPLSNQVTHTVNGNQIFHIFWGSCITIQHNRGWLKNKSPLGF